jgi:hypothetical protein
MDCGISASRSPSMKVESSESEGNQQPTNAALQKGRQETHLYIEKHSASVKYFTKSFKKFKISRVSKVSKI